MSSRPQYRHRVAWARGSALCPALVVLVATLVTYLGYVPSSERPERVAGPAASVSVAHERLGSPAGHDQCCGLPTREARAVLPVGAQPLPAVTPRLPVVTRPAATPRSPALPPARGAPDLHVLQVQRI
ncbi:hypothetical protein [Streptomyces sp. 2A115]|uniref:hypothetical protein n=1 Tax=Streptomyces sp. 2A115 TaxID=3457439 RepID=UPI003FD23A0D